LPNLGVSHATARSTTGQSGASSDPATGGGAAYDSPPLSTSTSRLTASGWARAKSIATAPPIDVPTSCTGLPSSF
jgi:hypothetical protein